MSVSAHTPEHVEHLYHLAETDSTNTFAKKLLDDGIRPDKGFIVIRADRQHAGRGRLERSFFSNVPGGLWVSLICHIEDISRHFSINRALSLAICDTLQNHASLSTYIKWPNDIYCCGKKICGILLESSGVHAQSIIAGFGLNVNIDATQFPSNLTAVATSVLIETGNRLDLDSTLHSIICSLHQYLLTPAPIVHETYSRRLYRIGSRIEVDEHKGTFAGVAVDGQLQLVMAGDTVSITSGTLRYLD